MVKIFAALALFCLIDFIIKNFHKTKCPNCGTQFRVPVCSNCGRDHVGSKGYCSKCGKHHVFCCPDCQTMFDGRQRKNMF